MEQQLLPGDLVIIDYDMVDPDSQFTIKNSWDIHCKDTPSIEDFDKFYFAVVCIHPDAIFLTPMCSCGCFNGSECWHNCQDYKDRGPKRTWGIVGHDMKAVRGINERVETPQVVGALGMKPWRPLAEVRKQQIRDGWETVW